MALSNQNGTGLELYHVDCAMKVNLIFLTDLTPKQLAILRGESHLSFAKKTAAAKEKIVNIGKAFDSIVDSSEKVMEGPLGKP